MTSSEKYVSDVTLEYLLNPTLFQQIYKNKETITENESEVRFYRKRILQSVKELCKFENRECFNSSITNAFNDFTSVLIYHYKSIDSKDILQSEYCDNLNDNSNDDTNDDIEKSQNTNLENDNTNDSQIKQIIQKSNEMMIKEKKTVNNLDSFVKKINTNEIKETFPKKRATNLKAQELRYKGLKKKNVDNI